jgi:Uma2 family endonuclease
MSQAATGALTKNQVTARKPRRIRTRYGPGSSGLLMTAEQFDALRPEQLQRGCSYELINGVLIVSPQPGAGERGPNDELAYLLRQYREAAPRGSVIDETLPEQTVPATNRRRADRVIWTRMGRVPNAETDIPSIVIEFVSKRRRDALRDNETKRDEYLGGGVKEYWVIDRFRRIMTVYYPTPAGPTYEIVTELQTYQTDLLPGFVLPLSRLLAKADQWKRPPKPRQPKQSRKPNPPAGGSDG